MAQKISQMTAAATLVGTEQVELSQLSTSVTMTATTLSALASDNSFNDSATGFITAGFAVNDTVKVSGFTGSGANNIFSATVTAITAGKLTIGGTDGDVIVDDAAGESVTITRWGSRRSTLDEIVAFSLSAAARVPAQRYTIELANTTDSDPGAGLIKFNNATPASATFLYIDDSTSDGVDLSAFFASLSTAGFVKIQSVADAGEWVVFKWSAVTDGTGYWKFAVTAQASLGTLDDADTVLIEFDSGASGSGVVATDAIWDAKGDLAVGTGADTASRLTAGANDCMLMADSAEATGLKWATPAQVATAVQADGLDADAAGFRGLPQNAQTGNYTLVADDAGKHIYHASGAGAGDTYTIPANGSVAFEIGTAVTFTNMATDSVAIAITTDTLYLAGAGTTGTRTLAQYGVATALKLTSTTWIISGTGLT